MNHVQAVIASVPWTDTESPLMAPAALKSCLEQAGISSLAIDLNAEIYHILRADPARDSILKFFLTEQVDRSRRQDIFDLIDGMARRLIDTGAQWICLSLLTYLSQISCRWLCFRIRQLAPDARIVIGGAGAFTSLKSLDSYAHTLKSQGLIDFFISGDGELSLPALIQGQVDYAGVDSTTWQQITDLDAVPIPDFGDYDWNLYTTKKISVLGSRGCVRSCTFCDIHEHWTKYQWRQATSIFQEMCHQQQQHGIRYFTFADSLVNGNQKEYRALIRLLADHNDQLPLEQRICWTGMFIIRPQDQMRDQDWELTARSGATLLHVGVESFVEHIRYHIRKPFSNRDLDYALRMAQRHGIDMALLMIVGYVTETEQDFQEQLRWVRDNRHYAGNPVQVVQIGSGLGILPGTWLDQNAQQLGVTRPESGPCQDWTRPDIGSTPQVRMRWHSEMQNCLRENGFAAAYQEDNHTLIEHYINDKYRTSQG